MCNPNISGQRNSSPCRLTGSLGTSPHARSVLVRFLSKISPSDMYPSYLTVFSDFSLNSFLRSLPQFLSQISLSDILSQIEIGHKNQVPMLLAPPPKSRSFFNFLAQVMILIIMVKSHYKINMIIMIIFKI